MNTNPVQSEDPSFDRRLLLGAAGLAGLVAISSAKAGPLTPPTGGISSTGKVIGEVEPRIAVNATNTPGIPGALYRITQPGSYYLTGNLVATTGNYALQITANHVDLDLNGFTISSGGVNSFGVYLASFCRVRNGRLSGHYYGISSYDSTSTVIEDLVITDCTVRGILGNYRTVVRRCLVSGASPVGIEFANNQGRIEDSVISGATVKGIYINSSSIVRGCTVNSCATGIYVGYGSRVEHCDINSCTGTGLEAGQRSSVDCCTVTATSGAGIGVDLSDGASLTNSALSANVIGARGSQFTRIANCNFDGNTIAAVKHLGAQNLVESCTLTRNAIGVDMSGASGNYVHKCVLFGNTTAYAVSAGGNWYPNVVLSGVNAATNPLASVVS